MERVDARKVSTAEFMAKYERTYTPCVVTHAQDNWQANKKWTFPVKIILHLVCIKVLSCVVSSRYSSVCNTKLYIFFTYADMDDSNNRSLKYYNVWIYFLVSQEYMQKIIF